MTETASLQAVADRQAIADLIYRYCRAVDRIDAELGYSIYHEDGTADYGPTIFQGSGRGSIDHICAQHRAVKNHSHQVSNLIIELDGDKAASEAYVTATLQIDFGGQLKLVSVWGRYVDRWSRRDGRWAIDARQALIDFDDVRDAAPMTPEGSGRRDKSDPSYAALRGPR